MAVVKDIREESLFQQEVLQASEKIPVLVDFWAEWCGPCRILGPILEKIAVEEKERLKVVKVNTEYCPNLAYQYHIQGIPAVKLFSKGKVVGEFVGALPESAIRAFLAEHLPNPALERAKQFISLNKKQEAFAELKKAGSSAKVDEVIWQWLESFGKELSEREFKEAIDLISPYGSPFSERKHRLLELLKAGEFEEVKQVFSNNGEQLAERLLSELAVAQDQEQKEKLRQKLVDLFTTMGPNHPKVSEYRKQMARLLY